MIKSKHSKNQVKTVLKNTLIGLEARVERSNQKNQVGFEGRIVDETLQTITLETKTGKKLLRKKELVLLIRFPEEEMIVEGKNLLQRPEERIKKLWKKAR